MALAQIYHITQFMMQHNATKTAEINAIFGGFRALVDTKGAQMLDS